MKKKICAILLVLVCFFSFTNVKAASESNFIDLQAYADIYRLSEDSDVSLPFVKFFNEKATFDKKLDKSGLSIASKTIDIEENIKGVHTIVSGDTVNIKGSVEYGFIISSNVVISGTIEKDVVILAESIFITDTANIGGDIIAMANTIELKGNVAGNFIGNSDSFLMEGKVQKDFRVLSNSMTFGETTINGKIYIETNSELNISDKYPNAVVNKIQTRIMTEAEKKDQIINTILKSITAIILFTLLNMLIRKINPNLFVNLANKFKNHSSYGVIAGVLGLTTIPFVIFILILLSMFGAGVVTTPLLVVYIALIVVIISLAKFITGSVIYELAKDKLKVNNKLKELGILLAIYTVLYILCYMPYISWFMTMATILFSSGIIITGFTRKNKE